jgi:hypothetical protein
MTRNRDYGCDCSSSRSRSSGPNYGFDRRNRNVNHDFSAILNLYEYGSHIKRVEAIGADDLGELADELGEELSSSRRNGDGHTSKHARAKFTAILNVYEDGMKLYRIQVDSNESWSDTISQLNDQLGR